MKNLERINQTASLSNILSTLFVFVLAITNAFGNTSDVSFNENLKLESTSWINGIYNEEGHLENIQLYESRDNLVSSILSMERGNGDVPGRYNLPDNMRPAFESMPVWRLQLRVKTGNVKKAGTDDNVYLKLTNSKSSVYYLDRAGDDREKNKVNIYDILDPNIRTMRDIKNLKMMIKGNDGWCVQSVEILINDVKIPVFSKSFKNCKWLDGNSHSGPGFYISGKELRSHRGWRYTSQNRALWLPPMVLKRAMLEEMVESYVGHMMNSRPDMKKLEFGKKYGRAYVQAKHKSSSKLKFDLDLAYHKGIDFEVDVDFDMVIKCKNNKISLKAEAVKGKR